MNKRQKGDEFEKQLSRLFSIRLTAKSGAHWDNADLATETVLIEAKVKDVPFFKPSKREVEKVIAQANKHGKDWVYIQKTNGGTFVLCSLDFFEEVSEEYFDD